MNNIMTTNTSFAISEEAMSFLENGGKYVCIVFGICTLYNLCVGAMEKGYAFNVNLDPEGKVGFNFTPPQLLKNNI